MDEQTNPLLPKLDLSLSGPKPVVPTEDELYPRLLTHLEANWWVNSEFPTPKALINKFGCTKEVLRTLEPRLNSALKVRGLPPVEFFPPAKPKTPEGEFDPNFVVAVSLVADTLDKRAISKKLQTIDVTTRQWKAWLAKPDYLAYYQKHVNKAFDGAADSAKLSLAKNIEAGDLQSIRYYNEVTGIYRPNQQTLLNLGILIGRLMEILPKYLDSNALVAVADEFEQVLAIETTGQEVA